MDYYQFQPTCAETEPQNSSADEPSTPNQQSNNFASETKSEYLKVVEGILPEENKSPNFSRSPHHPNSKMTSLSHPDAAFPTDD